MNKLNYLRDNKNKMIINVMILILIVFLLVFSFFSKSGDKINYEDELNASYEGFVVNKYIDSSDHSICKIVLKSSEIISVWDNCYQKVKIGDSIVKKKGNFDFIVYKSNDTIIVNIEDNLIIPNDKKR